MPAAVKRFTAGAALVDLASEIQQEYEAACSATRSALEHARRAGELLNEAKASLPHGEWLPWLQAHCPLVSPRVAQEYMCIARKWDRIANTNRGSDLPIREARRLLAKRPDRESDEPPPLDLAPGGKVTSRPLQAAADQRSREAVLAPPRTPRGTRAPRAEWKDLTDSEQREVRRIRAELEELPFERHTFIEAGPGHGGDQEVIPGAPGAAVFWDIVGGDPKLGRSTFRYTRGAVIEGLGKFIAHARRSIVSDLTVDVARRRSQGDKTLSPPSLPPESGDDNTITLTREMVETCRFLKPILGTTTPSETIAVVLKDARSWHAFDQHVRLDDLVAESASTL